jgi:integrase
MQLACGSTTFGDLPLKSIRRSHIESWVKTMTTNGLAPGTVFTRFNNVRRVFRAAQRDKVIGSDPTDGITLPRKRRAEAAMTIPSPEDVGSILAAAPAWFRPLIGLCAFAGLRLGEAVAVQLDDIDFLRRTLTVSRQGQKRARNPREVRAPKYGSQRAV